MRQRSPDIDPEVWKSPSSKNAASARAEAHKDLQRRLQLAEKRISHGHMASRPAVCRLREGLRGAKALHARKGRL